MKTTRRWWPSAGFVAVWATYALVAVFFIWGFSTPSLDRVWTLYHELKTGGLKRLKSADRKLLLTAAARYDSLAGALLEGREIGIISAHRDGWMASPTATILRTPRSGKVDALQLEIQTPADLLPFSLLVRGSGWRNERLVSQPGPLQIGLPKPPAVPEIIELRARGRGLIADPSVLGIRICFPESVAMLEDDSDETEEE